ncbi:MAG: hypothetical protein IKV57_04570 [Clostridia bacterium]|nr:hypothetical protein [Clostridia bacterium]
MENGTTPTAHKENRFLFWRDKGARWEKLDNMAKIFPALVSREDSKVFRITCVLNEPVQPAVLEDAVNAALEEYPLFTCTLRHGMFWYYLERTDYRPVVQEESSSPCGPIYQNEPCGLLFNIYYYKNRVHLEVFHALCDGTGAFMFFRTVVSRYLTALHRDVLPSPMPDLGIDSSGQEKAVDSFIQYYNENRIKSKDIAGVLGKERKKVYRLRGQKTTDLRLLVTEGCASVSAMKEAARAEDVTLTVLITALLIASLRDIMDPRDRDKPVSIAIPVNLRNYFPSDTARNFFGFVDIEYDFVNGEDLSTICQHVAVTLQQKLTTEALEEIIAEQVKIERFWLVRILPLWLKNFVMNRYQTLVNNRRTVCLSNMGKITMPKELSPFIDRFLVFNSSTTKQVCICSYQDRMEIAFSGILAGRELERSFFRRLSALDPGLTITTNYTGKELDK